MQVPEGIERLHQENQKNDNINQNNQNFQSDNYNSQLQLKEYSEIKINKKKNYNFFMKLCCCKCFLCCQRSDDDILHSSNRKKQSKRLISQWAHTTKENMVLNPLLILIRLYVDDQSQDYFELLKKCRLNPDYTQVNHQRNDLEFYVPQLVNWFVFHDNLNNHKLRLLLREAGSIDFFFGHLLYFQLKSVSKTIYKKYTESYQQVEEMLQHYVEILQNDFGDKRLIACEMVKPLDKQKQEKLRQQENWDQIQLKIQEYGTGFWDPSSLEDSENITTNHIVLNNYTSKYDKTSSINPFYKSNQQQIKEQKMEENKSNTSQNVGFLSTINFIEDLIQISEDLKFAEPKVVSLRSELQKLNQHLPASIYIPFFTDSIRNHVILNIVAKEAKVFSTKERAPFYICVELFRPEEESEKNLQDSLVTKIESKMRQQKQDVKIWSYDLKLSQPLTALVKKNPLTKQERLYGSDDQSFNQLVQESRSFKQAQQQKSTQALLKPSIQKNESYKNKNDKKNKKNCTKIDNDIKEPLLTKETDDDDLDDSQNQLEQPQNTQQSRQINLNPKEAQINQNQERSDQDTNGEKTQNGLSNEQIDQHKEQISKTFVDQNQHNQDQNNLRTLSFQVSGENGRSTIINRQKSTTIGTAYFYDREIQQKVQEEHELEENKQGEEEYINHDEIQIIEEEDEPQSRDQKSKQQKLSNQENASNLKNNSKIKAGQKSKDASFIAEQFVNQYRIKKQITIQSHDNQKIDKNSMQYQIFGEDLEEQEKRIRQQSIYGHFKSWKLIHLIIKTGDNLKQEQFAQQLIYQFQQIFELEKTDLLLRPYEILSVGPGEGLMETVKNSVTFDSLHKTLQTNYKNITDLDVFFRQFYGENFGKARENFLNSLAAYSLVCYFLQVKDRHNGNILLHKDGYLVHIDFGFFFSNAPGQGLAFEKNVPFKMLQDYIVILGGTKSYSFQRFRRKFHKGFMAAKRHQDKIMILAKMMFSGHGSTLPCFEAGEQAIKDLEQRFNPPGIQTEQQLYNHTQQLINQSIDNWRAKWYDRYQYYCQGIFY